MCFSESTCTTWKVERDNLGESWRSETSEDEPKSLINKGLIPLLIRRSLVRAQVEEPKKTKGLRENVTPFFLAGMVRR
jgi:hypothetical protein